jgi:hypothetical protein
LCLVGGCASHRLPAAVVRRVRCALHADLVALQLASCDIWCPRCETTISVGIEDDPSAPDAAPPPRPPPALPSSPPPPR